ncbi:hypothetical protein P4571_08345 [Niallia alba]|nr:hypothetical protein [Niallia alba]
MEDEIEKIKKNPVYFVEKYLGVKLSFWQKQYLKLQQKLPVHKSKRRNY